MCRLFTTIISLCFFAVLGGCSISNNRLPSDHMEYNKAVNLSINKQLLLNIVRAHFSESSLYVSIKNVTSKHSLESNASLSYFNPFNTGGAAKVLHTLTGTAGITYKEEPSFIYAPETNDQYAVELLQPLRLKALFLVVEAETDLGDILRLMLRRIGPYPNFPAEPIKRPLINNLTHIKDYIKTTRIIDKIFAQNGYQVAFKNDKKNDTQRLIIPIPKDIRLSRRDWKILASLGIHKGDPVLILCDHALKQEKDTIYVQVRSLINVTNFLSFAVANSIHDPMYDNILSQQINNTYDEYHKLLTKFLLNIRNSARYPSNSFIAIHRLNSWYYIEDNDINSKTTFRLFRLFNDLTQAGAMANNILISS